MERRVENGTLRIESYRLSFDLDENGAPVDCQPYVRTEANSLIEEVCWFRRLSLLFICSDTFPCSSCYSRTLPWRNKLLLICLSKPFSAVMRIPSNDVS